MTLLKHAGSWLLAGLLGLSVSAAQAAMSLPAVSGPLTTTVGDAVVVPGPGSQAMPTVSFTFDTPFDLAAVLLNVDYDTNLMSFNAAASTVAMGGTVATLPEVAALLAAAPTGLNYTQFTNDDPGAFSASAFYGAGHYPVAPGTYVFTAAFDLKPAFTAGMVTEVNVWGDLGDAAFNPPLLFDEFANVTAVPEPETWLMLLGGLGLLASRVRRRNR